MAAKKAPARKPAKKRAAPKKAAAKKSPDESPVHQFSRGRSKRLRAAQRCPGGRVQTDTATESCDDCPSASECSVARFAEG